MEPSISSSTNLPWDLRIIRWLWLLPLMYALSTVAGIYVGFIFIWIINMTQFMFHAESLVNVILAMALPLTGGIGLFIGSLLGTLFAPNHKSLVYRLSPCLIFGAWLLLKNYSSIAYLMTFVPGLQQMMQPWLVILTSILLTFSIKPELFVKAFRSVFRDKLSELDKAVLLAQLELLLSMPALAFNANYPICHLPAYLAPPVLFITYLKHRRDLSEQGRIDSKLLCIITIFVSLAIAGGMAITNFRR